MEASLKDLNVQEQEIQQVIVNDECVAKVNVFAEEPELAPYKKRFIQEKCKHVILRGYRKGKAPEEMVARLFKDEAREMAKSNVIYAKYMKLLQDHKLQPLSEPKIDTMSDTNGKITANILVEVLQPLILGQYLGLEIEKMPDQNVDMVNKTLEEIKNKYPKLTPLNDVVVENGQVVNVDFTMSYNDKELEVQKDLKLSLGLNLFFKPFEEQVLGMKVGETKECDLLFPESYGKEEYRGKIVHFVINVKSIEAVSQYSNDELAVLLGYDSGDALLDSIKKEADLKYKNDEHNYYENQILEQLLASHDFKIPQKLLDNEEKRLLVEEGANKDNVAQMAFRFVKTDLILRTVYERHTDIHLTQEEFNTKISELASKANDTMENTIERLKKSNKLNLYINYLTNSKVIDFLIGMSDKKEAQILNEELNKVER